MAASASCAVACCASSFPLHSRANSQQQQRAADAAGAADVTATALTAVASRRSAAGAPLQKQQQHLQPKQLLLQQQQQLEPQQRQRRQQEQAFSPLPRWKGGKVPRTERSIGHWLRTREEEAFGREVEKEMNGSVEESESSDSESGRRESVQRRRMKGVKQQRQEQEELEEVDEVDAEEEDAASPHGVEKGGRRNGSTDMKGGRKGRQMQELPVHLQAGKQRWISPAKYLNDWKHPAAVQWRQQQQQQKQLREGGVSGEDSNGIASPAVNGSWQQQQEIESVVDAVMKKAFWEDVDVILNAWTGRKNRRNFPPLIKAVARHGDLKMARKVFDWMKNQRCYRARTDVYTTLMLLAARHRKLNQVRQLYREMQEWRCAPDVHTFTALIIAHGKVGEWERAVEAFDEMLRNKVAPSRDSYNALMHACGVSGQWQHAFAIFNRMQSDGVAPDIVTVNTLLTALKHAQQYSAAVSFFRSLPSSPDPRLRRLTREADVVTLNVLMACHAKLGHVEEVLRLFRQLQRGEVQGEQDRAGGEGEQRREGGEGEQDFSASSSGAAVKDMSLAGRSTAGSTPEGAAATALAAAAAAATAPPALTAVAAMSTVAAESGGRDGSVSVSSLPSPSSSPGSPPSPSGLRPNLVTYNTVLHTLAAAGRPLEARAVFESMIGSMTSSSRSSNRSPNNSRSSSSSSSSSGGGGGGGGRDSGVAPNRVTFNTLIDAFATQGMVEEARDAFDALCESGFEPDVVSYTSLIHACGRAGRPDEAVELLRRMRRQSGLSSSANSSRGSSDGGGSGGGGGGRSGSSAVGVDSLSGLVGSAGRSGERGRAARPSEPNMVTYNALIDALGRAGRLEEAVRLKEEMESEEGGWGVSRFRANAVTYGALFTACARAGRTDVAAELAAEADARGIVLTSASYNALILAYAGAAIRAAGSSRPGAVGGDVGSGRRDLSGIPRRRDSAAATVTASFSDEEDGSGVRGREEVEAAEESVWAVLEQMRERGVGADGVTYGMLVDFAGKMGRVDRAEVWFEELCSQPNLIEGAYGAAGALEAGTALIHAYGQQGRLREARRVLLRLQQLQQQRQRQHQQQQKQGGSGRGGRGSSGRAIGSCAPNVVSYTALIQAASVAGDWEEAESAFVEMTKSGIRADEVAVATLLHALNTNGQFGRAVAIARHFLRLDTSDAVSSPSSPSLPSSPSSTSSPSSPSAQSGEDGDSAKTAEEQGKAAAALALAHPEAKEDAGKRDGSEEERERRREAGDLAAVQQQQQLLPLQRATGVAVEGEAQVLLATESASESESEAERRLVAMLRARADGVAVTEVVCNEFLHACCRQRNWWDALSLFRTVFGHPSAPPSVSTQWEDGEARERGNLSSSSFSSEGASSSSFKKGRAHGRAFSQRGFGLLLDTLARSDRTDLVPEVLRAMKQCGVVPTRATCHSLVKALSAGWDWQGCLEVLVWMNGAGMLPSLHAVKMTLTALRQAGEWQHAWDLYLRLPQYGLQADASVNEAVLAVLDAAGQTQRAAALRFEMSGGVANRNIFVNHNTIAHRNTVADRNSNATSAVAQ